MCGTVSATPLYGLDFGRHKDESFAATIGGGRLRKTRSLQDLRAEFVVELPSPEQPRAATLRRRISSVEDLILLAAKAEQVHSKMAGLASSNGPDPNGATAPLATEPRSLNTESQQQKMQHTDEPCSSPNCDGNCSLRSAFEAASIGIANAPASAAIEEPNLARSSSSILLEPPVIRKVPEVDRRPSIGRASAFESAFYTPAPRPADAAPLPLLGGSPPKPGASLLESLKAPRPSLLPTNNIGTSTAGSSPVASGTSTPLGTRSTSLGEIGSSKASPRLASALGLDDRRKSCDLGHVAPASGHLGQGSAAVELFYRLNHARQTVDYVKRQATQYAPLSRGHMDVWDALDTLNSLREYESALLGGETCDADMPLLDHALQTAEACRLAYPEHDWMGIVGLIHGLGKLLAHAKFGAEPQWAVCGESFPVGCRFHPSIVHSQYFQANPDRRRRAYATPTGVYQPGCGLSQVCMSWSGAEYLYMVLARNKTCLPPEALFLLRYQKFAAVLRPGQPYGELLSAFDRNMLPTLAKFRELAAYKKVELPEGRLEGEALKEYYDALLAKYIPQGTLRW